MRSAGGPRDEGEKVLVEVPQRLAKVPERLVKADELGGSRWRAGRRSSTGGG
jgi:hypothetical protein